MQKRFLLFLLSFHSSSTWPRTEGAAFLQVSSPVCRQCLMITVFLGSTYLLDPMPPHVPWSHPQPPLRIVIFVTFLWLLTEVSPPRWPCPGTIPPCPSILTLMTLCYTESLLSSFLVNAVRNPLGISSATHPQQRILCCLLHIKPRVSSCSQQMCRTSFGSISFFS